MHLTTGTRLGPYEILSPLGAGGMGEVYRARDTRLGRDVAIKVLPQHLRENAEVHARFEREARTISSLNHPHICTLHDVGRAPGEGGSGDIEYIVMELVDGETLAQRLARGPVPVPEALKLGIQIADALDRAHRAGIVHRDFKPGNVMLTRSGAKLMDFGLARAAGVAGPGTGSGSGIPHLTQSPTVASPLTAEGAIVGTFLYMAPEQLEGRESDVRSDLWALGCVLYEMVTGRRAFEGRTQASLIGAIMGTEPPAMSTLVPLAPPALEALVRGLLAKDPEERIQTAHDVKLQLTWIAQSGSQSGVAAPLAPRRRLRREPFAWGAAVLAALAAGYFALRAGTGGGGADAGVIRFTVPVPPSVSTMSMPRLSPDGRVIAFAAEDSAGRKMIWVRPLDALAANVVPGTEGAAAPFWSPDSRMLGFIAGGKLKKIPFAGGPATVVCDAPSGSDGSWSRNDVILFDGGGSDPIWRVSAAGGVPTVAIRGDSVAQVGWPAFLPDGRHFFFSRISGGTGTSEIMFGALGDTATRRLEIAGSRVEYSPDGYLLFARDRTLLAQRFDARAMKLQGEPFPVAEDLPVAGNALANFTVSRNGVLVYRSTGETKNRLVWLDRTGRELAELAPAADFRAPALSPGADRVAIRLREVGSTNMDLRVMDLVRGTSTRFTFDPAPDGNPVWSPDGSSIAWTVQAGDSDAVAVKSATGLGETRIVARHFGGSAVLDWSRDGQWILFQGITAGSGMDVFAVPASGAAPPQRVLGTPFGEGRARFSPDARWIVYESDESGRAEVYVVPFHGSAGKWQISTRGGTDPFWSHDGREIFYLSPDRRLMAVPVTVGTTFSPGTPQPLFRVVVESSARRNVYDVAPDGKRFLFLVTAGEASTPMTVVVNWRAAQRTR
ncbi:MAG: serine/threonine-protein kinase [Candidatus Eisenbacteria bacterium]|nr:serine/threonine-protein kinase [Candidatus Eisenbacteria bacterium]